jgi:nucleotide-binding universal stress UspA family protein
VVTVPAARPVLVGVDGAPGSAGALRYAVAEATRRAVPVELVHAAPGFTPTGVPFGPSGGVSVPVEVADLERVGIAVLGEAAATASRLAPGIQVVTHLACGSPSGAVVDLSSQAQLLVVGRETRRGLERVLTGATTAAVASRAQCEVAVVPSFWVAESPRGRVVAGIKRRQHTHELLRRAFAEASTRGASLTLVTSWELPDPFLDRIERRTHADEWRADGQRLLDGLVAEWVTAYPDVRVETRVEHGAAASVLLRASSESDLLLISRRHHALPTYGHLGGVAHALLRVSDVPVLVVPCLDDSDGPALEGLAPEEAAQALT